MKFRKDLSNFECGLATALLAQHLAQTRLKGDEEPVRNSGLVPLIQSAVATGDVVFSGFLGGINEQLLRVIVLN